MQNKVGTIIPNYSSMDNEAKNILKKYKAKIEKRQFNELDILGLLIFLRSYTEGCKRKYPYLREFMDLIAHRKRDRGSIMDNLINVKKNNYQLDKNKKLVDVKGIKESEWKTEIEDLLSDFNINSNDKIIKEITLCIYVLANNTEYEKIVDGILYKGEVTIIVDKKNSNIGLSYTESSDKPHCCFALYGKYKFTNESNDILLKDDIELKRKYKVMSLYYKNKKILDVK